MTIVQIGIAWLDMKETQPSVDGDILFIPKDGITDETVGYAANQMDIVFLKRTSIKFDDILYWLPIPPDPRKQGKQI